MKIMIYGINLWDVKGDDINIADMTDVEFIHEAKRQGHFWTLKEFETAFNDYEVSDEWMIRVIDLSTVNVYKI